MLGGLLEDSYSQAEDKVPVMGDIPLLGNLFRSENRSRKKTNLMVFLRPVVVRDAAASDALMLDRYESIRALQQAVQPAPARSCVRSPARPYCRHCAPRRPIHRSSLPTPTEAPPMRHPALRLRPRRPAAAGTMASSSCSGMAPRPTRPRSARCCATRRAAVAAA